MAERNERKTRVGEIVSDKMDKSVVVKVQRQVKHATYGRTVLKSKKYAAHDEQNECKVGDTVRIMETRPISRTKRWRVCEVLTRAK